MFDDENPATLDSDKLTAILADIAEEPKAKAPKRDSSWVNPADIREGNSESWTEYTTSDHFPTQVMELLKQCVLLPRGDFQAPIAASYLMLPSVFCNKIPVAFSQGASGSGKSQIAYFACSIHDIEPLGSGSTFPAIRNQIRQNRFYDPKEGDRDPHNEKNCCLAWEDINPQSLRAFDGNIFNLIKLGVDRKGKISIAQLGGENIEFSVFSPKFISSIHAIYAEHDFRELIRRIIVIEHKRYSQFTQGDYSEFYRDVTPDDLLDISAINWEGMSRKFNDFWMQKETAQEFAKAKRSLRRPQGSIFPAALFDMYKDLMATGVVCGYFESTKAAVNHMMQYSEWHRDRIENAATGTEVILRELINSKRSLWDIEFERLKSKGQEDFCDSFSLDASEIKLFLDEKHRLGEIEINPNARERSTVMESLGFRLQLNPSTNKNEWFECNQ
jgi:hypothetical protein